MASTALRKPSGISLKRNPDSRTIPTLACALSSVIILLISGCIMDDIESMISIFDPEHQGGYDLEIAGITLLPENPDVGETVEVSVKIRNRGRRRSKAVPINLVIGDDEMSRLELPPISSEEEGSFTFQTKLALPAGISTLKMEVDPDGETSEINRQNNIRATTILVGEPSNTSVFSWTYKGMSWELVLRTPLNDLEGLSQDRRIFKYDNYLEYIQAEDRTVAALAEVLKFYSDHVEYQSYDEVSFVLAFVQDMPYTSDLESRGDNYPRYPIETLVDGGGDCEDSSALFTSIISNPEFFNYGTVLIIIEDHMGVGVSGNEGVGGVYFEIPTSSARYYYCETTGSGYAIGDMPEEFEGGAIQEIIRV